MTIQITQEQFKYEGQNKQGLKKVMGRTQKPSK